MLKNLSRIYNVEELYRELSRTERTLQSMERNNNDSKAFLGKKRSTEMYKEEVKGRLKELGYGTKF